MTTKKAPPPPLADTLVAMGACRDAVTWSRDFGSDYRRAWEECPRADWLLWLAGELIAPAPLLVLAACDCARTALRFVPEGEDRPRLAIEAAEKWAELARTQGPRAAAARAAAAWSAAARADAARAAAARADAAWSAAAWSAAASADAARADAAWSAAASAAAASAAAARAAAARADAQKKMADLVRKRISFAAVLRLWKKAALTRKE